MNWNNTTVKNLESYIWVKKCESKPDQCSRMWIEPKNSFWNGNGTHEIVKKCIMVSMQMFGNGSRTHEHIESVLKPDQC